MTGKLVAALGLVVAALAADSIESARESPVLMVAEDGQRYLVDPHETLGEAVTHSTAAQHDEEGHCVPETLEKKPPGSVACTCYEVTECKGNESRQCKRHCRKDLCECCAI